MKTMSFRRTFGAVLFGAIVALMPLARAETVVTESAGTVSSFSPDALVITTERGAAPTRYVVGQDVTYVDEAGVPVSMEIVRSGLPVTVSYVREADRVIARRVVVHRHPAAVVEERHPAVVEERHEVRRPVVVEERRVEEHRPAIVEERVVKPAPRVIEERTTTTTTTVTPAR